MKKLLLALFFIGMSSFLMAQIPDPLHYSFDPTWTQYKPSKEEIEGANRYLRFSRTFEYRVTDKGEVERYNITHMVTLVTNEKGIEENNKLRLPVYDKNTLIDMKARVLVNGKTVSESGLEDLKTVKEENRESKLVAFNGVTKGALVEIVIILRTQSDLYDSQYMQFSDPTSESSFSLVVPARLRFNLKLYNAQAPVSDTVIDDKRVYSIKLKQVPAFEEEKWALENSNKIRVEYTFDRNAENGAEGKKFSELGRSVFEGIMADVNKYSKDIKKFLKKANIRGTDAEKAFQIEHYIKSNIAIREDAEVPTDPDATIQNRFATEYGMTRLLLMAYYLEGFPVELVITTNKNNKRFDRDFHSWSYLSEALLYLPSIQMYIDPGYVLGRNGRIQTHFLGQDALHIKPLPLGDKLTAIATIKTIPANLLSKTEDKFSLTAKLDEQYEQLKINVHHEMNGYSDMSMREICYIAPDDKRKEFLEEYVKNMGANCIIKKLEFGNYDLGSFEEINKPFLLDYQLDCPDYIEKAGENLILKVGELIGKQSELYQEKKRMFLIDQPYTHGYNRTLKIEIPANYTVKGMDKLNIKYQYNVNGQDAMGFISSYTLEGNILTISCKEYYALLTYPVDRFEDFRRVINAAADFNKIALVLEKK